MRACNGSFPVAVFRSSVLVPYNHTVSKYRFSCMILDGRWSVKEILLKKGTSIVGLLRCLEDVGRPGAFNGQVEGSVYLLQNVAMD